MIDYDSAVISENEKGCTMCTREVSEGISYGAFVISTEKEE